MKFEIEIEVDDDTGIMHLKHEGNLILISKRSARVLDIVDDIIEHQGKTTLVSDPIKTKLKPMLLALGGPKNGQYLPWDGKAHTYQVLIPQKAKWTDDPAVITESEHFIVLYRVIAVTNGKDIKHVYFDNSIQPRTYIAMLQEYLLNQFIQNGDRIID